MDILRNVIIRQYFAFDTEISFILPMCLFFCFQENVSTCRFVILIQGFTSVPSAFFTPEDIFLSL